MAIMVDNAAVAPEGSDVEPASPVRWIAEFEGGIAGAIDRTSRGKYRATDSRGHTVGTYRTLTEARDQLAKKHDSTAIQRMDQSSILLIGGFVALLATAAIAVVGIVLLLGR